MRARLNPSSSGWIIRTWPTYKPQKDSTPSKQGRPCFSPVFSFHSLTDLDHVTLSLMPYPGNILVLRTRLTLHPSYLQPAPWEPSPGRLRRLFGRLRRQNPTREEGQPDSYLFPVGQVSSSSLGPYGSFLLPPRNTPNHSVSATLFLVALFDQRRSRIRLCLSSLRQEQVYKPVTCRTTPPSSYTLQTVVPHRT